MFSELLFLSLLGKRFILISFEACVYLPIKHGRNSRNGFSRANMVEADANIFIFIQIISTQTQMMAWEISLQHL